MFYRKWFSFLVLVIISVKSGTSEHEFEAGFSDGVSSCPNYENKKFNGDNLKLSPVADDDDLAMLEGYLEVKSVIKEGYKLEVMVNKETDVGNEPMFSCTLDVCESIQDIDAPWYPIFQAMDIDGCPIETGKYAVKDLELKLSFLDSLLNQNNMGKYQVYLEMFDTELHQVSCHRLEACIKEK